MNEAIFFIAFLFFFHLAFAQGKSGTKTLLPHYIKLQFSGGIGFISIGAGYSNKKEKLKGDLYYGYVLKKLAVSPFIILALKFPGSP